MPFPNSFLFLLFMKRLSQFLIICIGLSLASCHSFWESATDDGEEKTLLTGECLRSYELLHHSSTAFHINDYYGPKSFVFGFALDLDKTIEYNRENPIDYRYIPSENVLADFDGGVKRLQEQYESLYQDVSYGAGGFRVVTLFYKEGATLTADKDFAGHPKGENLSPYCNWRLMLHPLEELSLPVDSVIDYPYLVNTSGGIYFPIGDCTIIDEEVTFTLTIPVKVGMYLTWLYNLQSNPEAQIPFHDEVLHCTFTIGKSLR